MAAGPYGCSSCGVTACELVETDGPGCNGWVRAGLETVLHKIQLPPAPRSIVLSADINTACNQIREALGDDADRFADALKKEFDRVLVDGCAAETARIYKAALAKPFAPFAPPVAVPNPVDPLDVKYDGLTLRFLLSCDEYDRHEAELLGRRFTDAQRAAVSAHWSAQLRAKVDAAKQAERNVVTYCELDPDD